MESFELTKFSSGLTTEEQKRLLSALAHQIDKDLYPLQMGEIPEMPTLDWIRARLSAVLNQSAEHLSQSLAAILYRIDIPEKRIQSAMAHTHADERMALLVQLILEREAFKVWLRLNYRP